MATITTNKTRTFTDLDLTFSANPNTHDIYRLYDENAIKRSVRNLLLTNNYERKFHSEIGCQIRALLFEPASPLLNTLLKRVIINTLSEFEPRVKVTDIRINSEVDNNAVYVTLEFGIVNTNKQITMDIVLERSR